MKTITSLLITVLLAKVAVAAPLDLGIASASTPYDKYLSPVRTVLSNLDGNRASLDQIKTFMREGRNFRYSFENPYLAKLPSETAARHAGDCKDKALWLADQMGDSSVRFVIGKARATSKISHAWLYWKDSNNRWWILDCTNKREPIPADRVSSSEYIPLYSFSKGASYRHMGQTFASTAGVADAARTVASAQ